MTLCLVLAPMLHAQSSAAPPPAAALPVAPLPNAPTPAGQQPGLPVPPPNAQQGGVPPENETPQQRRIREREEAQRQVKAEEKQRIGGVVPNFNVVMGGTAVPLTPKQKFDLSFHTIIDPFTIGVAAVFGGGYGELSDDHTGYGHGPAGYFKRVGASYLDNVDGSLVGNALLPVILHQDPRYFRKGEGTIKSRIVYSALTTVICRGDNGKRQFNTSNVLGNFISGAISNAYYPSDERGFGLTIENASVVTLEGTIGAQLLEFSPDVIDKLHRRKQRKLAEKAAAQAAADAARQTPPAP